MRVLCVLLFSFESKTWLSLETDEQRLDKLYIYCAQVHKDIKIDGENINLVTYTRW